MDKTKFFQWLIISTLILIGLVLAFLTGLINQVNRADITKLSFIILILFFYYSVRIGIAVYGGAFLMKLRNEALFASNGFLSLGMIGTVIGFIYMLNISFGHLGATNTTALRQALETMGAGMGTALYTTAAGLVCSLLLRLQIYKFLGDPE